MKINSRVRIFRYRPAAILKIAGADALTFLQGQFTQELRTGVEEPVRYGLWLSQKGKILGDSFALRETEEQWWLVSYFSPAASIKARLESYIIADDVGVEDVSAAWTGVAVVGDQAEQWMMAKYGKLPLAGAFGRNDAGMIFRGRRGVESWEWLAPVNTMIATEDAEMATEEEMERWRIEHEVPGVSRDVGIGDLPNEAGLEADAISYSKGCYLGQEVMARLKSMGQVRRRLMRVKGTGRAPRVLPSALYSGEKRVGELRSAAPTGEGFVGLAMVSLLGVEPGASLRAEGDAEACIHIDPKTP